MKVKQIGSFAKPSKRNNPNQYRVYDPSGICPCLTGVGGGGLVPYIIVKKVKVKDATAKGYSEMQVGGGVADGIP